MTPKPLRVRPAARHDIRSIALAYRADAGPTVADRFLDALGFPGLRFRTLRGFPHLIFYVERADHIDAPRVLHGKRDIPATLRGKD